MMFVPAEFGKNPRYHTFVPMLDLKSRPSRKLSRSNSQHRSVRHHSRSQRDGGDQHRGPDQRQVRFHPEEICYSDPGSYYSGNTPNEPYYGDTDYA